MQYWSMVFAMLGVALLATAFFHSDSSLQLTGALIGSGLLVWGYLLSPSNWSKKRRKRK